MASFSNRVTTITQNTILPKVIDTVLNDNFLTYRVVSGGKKWSGVTLDRPVKVLTNTLGGSFSGMDTHSTSSVETRVLASYDPRAYEIPVAIPGLEKAVNAINESQVLNLVRVELESSQQDMVDQIGTLLYADGTGNSNKDFLGLDALADDGTSVVTLGSISRTTYPTNWKGVRTASSGVLSLGKLATLVSATAGGSALTQRPTIFISSETEFDLVESIISPTIRTNYDAQGGMVMSRTSKGPIPAVQLKGAMGYASIAFRGIPWIADEKAPTGTAWLLNENFLDWYGIKDPDLKPISLGQGNIEGVYDSISENTGFQWTEFMRPINQYGEVAHIYLLGNMVTFNPRRHGRLTGITGV